jgi:hypothetical protein
MTGGDGLGCVLTRGVHSDEMFSFKEVVGSSYRTTKHSIFIKT